MIAVAEALEDICAEKKLLEPELVGWLSGVKIPRPAKPPKARR